MHGHKRSRPGPAAATASEDDEDEDEDKSGSHHRPKQRKLVRPAAAGVAGAVAAVAWRRIKVLHGGFSVRVSIGSTASGRQLLDKVQAELEQQLQTTDVVARLVYDEDDSALSLIDQVQQSHQVGSATAFIASPPCNCNQLDVSHGTVGSEGNTTGRPGRESEEDGGGARHISDN